MKNRSHYTVSVNKITGQLTDSWLTKSEVILPLSPVTLFCRQICWLTTACNPFLCQQHKSLHLLSECVSCLVGSLTFCVSEFAHRWFGVFMSWPWTINNIPTIEQLCLSVCLSVCLSSCLPACLLLLLLCVSICILTVFLFLYFGLCKGSCAIPSNVADPVRSDHHWPSTLSTQASCWQILLPHFPGAARTHLDFLCSAAHYRQVSRHCSVLLVDSK